MMVKPSRSASASIASASVSPPALSSLILTASYLPTRAASEARSCALSSAQTGMARPQVAQCLVLRLGQRLLHQNHAGPGAGFEIGGEVAFAPPFIGVDDQDRRGAAARTAAMRSPSPP